MFDPKVYVAFNDAIFDYFFNSDRAGQLTTLALDDDAATQLGEEFAMSGPDFCHGLCSQVRAVINPLKSNPYEFWTRRNPRESTALLACAVLVMSRLGTTSDGVLQHQGFHASYNREVLNTTDECVPVIGQQDVLWERLARFLEVEESGQLGRLSFFEVLRYRHLNYPASQCLVRTSDRRRLHLLFDRQCDPERALSRDGIALILGEHAAELSLMFQRASRALAGHDQLARDFWNVIESEYAVWRATPQQVARIRASTTRRRETVDASDAPHDSSRTRWWAQSSNGSSAEPRRPPSVAGELESARVRPIRVRPALERIPSRLALVEPYRQPARLFVEAKFPEDAEPVDDVSDIASDGWSRLGNQVDANAFVEGFELTSGRFRIRHEGQRLAAFTLHDNAWITTETLKPDDPLRIVFVESCDEQIDELRSVATHTCPIAMSCAHLYCISVTLPRDVRRTDLPIVVGDALSSAQTVVRLSSGLRLRDGSYLNGAPPLVTFVHPTEETADVYIDDDYVGAATRDVPFRIPGYKATPGRRSVQILDRRRSFIVADQEQEAGAMDDAEDSELGMLVARHPPRLESNLVAETMRTAELSAMSAVVVVGADLLLPYCRTIS